MDPFDRANAEYPDLYLVSRKLELGTDSELDKLEAKWDVVLPKNYRHFIKVVGGCLYCDDLFVTGPRELFEDEVVTIGERTGDYNPWESGGTGLTKQQIMELRSFSGTAGGDYIGLHPSQPGALFFLPEGDDEIVRYNDSDEPYPEFYWRQMTHGTRGTASFKYAHPMANWTQGQVNLWDKTLNEDDFVSELKARWAAAGMHVVSFPPDDTDYFLRALDGKVSLGMRDGRPSLVTYQIDKDALPEMVAFLAVFGLRVS
jgi:hypothetical protein